MTLSISVSETVYWHQDFSLWKIFLVCFEGLNCWNGGFHEMPLAMLWLWWRCSALFFTTHQTGLDKVHYVRLSHAKLVKSPDASEKQIKEFENKRMKYSAESMEILIKQRNSYQHGICFCVCLFLFHEHYNAISITFLFCWMKLRFVCGPNVANRLKDDILLMCTAD